MQGVAEDWLTSFISKHLFFFDDVPKLVILYGTNMMCYLLKSGFAVRKLEPALNKSHRIYIPLSFLRIKLFEKISVAIKKN